MGTKVFDSATDLITFTRASGGTYLDSDGLLKTATNNIPRIEYAADGTLKGLLIEEQRTNLLLRSEEFNNASWGKSGVTITANAAVAPDGTTTADKAVDTATSAFHTVIQTASLGAGNFSATVYMKAAELSLGSIQFFSSSPSINTIARFDLASETATLFSFNGLTAPAISITNVGNGWYRCSYSANTASAAASFQVRVLANNGNLYTGDGTSGIYIWGAQLEAGAFPTSYIPTSGATATRSADIASIPVADFGYNQKAGTVVVEFDSFQSNENYNMFSLSDGTLNNRLSSSNTGFHLFVASGGVSQASLVSGSYTPNTVSKLAASFKADSFAAILDQNSIATDTSGSVPIVSDFRLGRGAAFGGQINGHIKSIQYYPRKLSNQQLVDLTS